MCICGHTISTEKCSALKILVLRMVKKLTLLILNYHCIGYVEEGAGRDQTVVDGCNQ